MYALPALVDAYNTASGAQITAGRTALAKGNQDMSAKSLAKLAADRDTVSAGQCVVKDSSDVLVAAVPTEALSAYTAVVGVVLAANIGAGYGLFRWSAYVVFIVLAVLAPLVLFRHRTVASSMDTRKVPIPECLTAGVAAAAWGLVMPGNPLTMVLTGNSLVFATTAILVGTAAAMGLATQQLGKANSKNPEPAVDDQVSARRAAVPARPDARPLDDASSRS